MLRPLSYTKSVNYESIVKAGKLERHIKQIAGILAIFILIPFKIIYYEYTRFLLLSINYWIDKM